MKITIDEISGDGSVVRFSHEAGQADGVWRGEGRPAIGPADVELAVPGRFWWDDDVRIVAAPPSLIVLSPEPAGAHSVTGVAVAVSDDGVLALRLGDGTVEIQTAGKAPAGVVGRVVEVDGPLIEIVPLAG